MINIYGPHDPLAKIALWNRISVFIQSHSGKFILFGDMNEVRSPHERYGSLFSNNEAEVFNSLINNSGLIDLPMGGHSFNWMNKSGTKLSKLDRFLISEEILSLIPDIKITSLDRMWSDHTPILLHCNKSDFGPVRLNSIIRGLVEKASMISLPLNNYVEPTVGRKYMSHDILKALKPKITLNKINEESPKKDLTNDLRTLDDKIEAGLASNEDCDNRIKILQEMHYLVNLGDMDTFQKARVKWDVEGDENINFFSWLD
ncbi:RNA-directed DNA polymerase, eukaryota, reverse transcriptase zinc-binding domain protein [Tanacetum coccineum]